jgi:hypothetical protein
MRTIRLLVLLLSALVISRPAFTANGPDVGDLWWNPAESGWGMQIVQNNNTLFATIFVYDEQGFPFWYTATLFATGIGANGAPSFAGDLYETRGPFFGAVPYNPAQVQVGKVGAISFTSPSVATGVLTYSVYGLTVTKNVQRQTLVLDNYNGTFLGRT